MVVTMQRIRLEIQICADVYLLTTQTTLKIFQKSNGYFNMNLHQGWVLVFHVQMYNFLSWGRGSQNSCQDSFGQYKEVTKLKRQIAFLAALQLFTFIWD